LIKRIRPQKTYQEIANRDESDFVDFFYPQVVYMLAAETGKNRCTMSPVKWVTPICNKNPMIAIGLMDGKIARNILKRKTFTLAMIPKERIAATIRLMESEWEPKTNPFVADQAFFIKAYKTHGLPWVECRVDKFLKLPENTYLVAAKVIHISKKHLPLKDRIIHHKDRNFINTNRISEIKYDRNGIPA